MQSESINYYLASSKDSTDSALDLEMSNASYRIGMMRARFFINLNFAKNIKLYMRLCSPASLNTRTRHVIC